MRFLIDIGHPGHVHFFKNLIWELESDGHQICISARKKDVTLDLLDSYGFEYVVLTERGNSFAGLAKEFFLREAALLKLFRDFRPHLVMEIGGMFICLLCRLLGIPSIAFNDSEPVPLDRVLVNPFASVIATPDCFMRDLGKNHLRYAGFHELAYLHPNRFKPDVSVLKELGLEKGQRFSILRFVSWNAGHDIGQHGFSDQLKTHIVESLEKFGPVFITSEGEVPENLRDYQIRIAPHRIHDALYYASLFMGDGATMATEAGILGTPSVRSSTMALNMGNFVELMKRYQLVFSYYDPMEALSKAMALLKQKDSKKEWQKRKNKLISEKIDTTSFMETTIHGVLDKRLP